MAQLGYKGFYCMGVWSFTVHNIMKKTRVLFVLFGNSKGWWVLIDDVSRYDGRVTEDRR